MNGRIAIIGGGWAGLACAVELAAAGQRVCLFEAAKQLGGRARRVDVQGHALDNGQHLLIGAYRETLRIMRLAGADPEKALARMPMHLEFPAHGFRLHLPRWPAPLHTAVGLLRAQGCGTGEKMAAIRFMRALQASGYRLTEECTVAELLDRHAQRGALRRFVWEALCLAALNTPPEHASAQVFANVLRDSLGGRRDATDLLLPRADLDRIFPSPAAHFITAHDGELRLSTRVEQIGADLSIDGERFAHIVIATAPQHAIPLLAVHPETSALAQTLATYDFEPIGTVYLGYPESLRLPVPMLGLGGVGRLGQWVFDRGPSGAPGVMSFVLSADGPWDQRDNEALARTLHDELCTALHTTLPAPRWHQVIRERRATFSCRPHLPRPATRTALRGVWLAGDYVCADYPATLEGAVQSGVGAALGVLYESALTR